MKHKIIFIVLIFLFVGSSLSLGQILDPQVDAQKYYEWAMREFNTNNLIDAEKNLLKVIELDASHEEAYFALGILYQKMRRLDEAVSIYKEGLIFNPYSSQLHYGLASVFIEQNRGAEAFYELKETVVWNDDFADGHAALGLVYEKREELDKAREKYEKALSIDPKQEVAKDGLLRLKAQEKKEKGNLVLIVTAMGFATWLIGKLINIKALRVLGGWIFFISLIVFTIGLFQSHFALMLAK